MGTLFIEDANLANEYNKCREKNDIKTQLWEASRLRLLEFAKEMKMPIKEIEP